VYTVGHPTDSRLRGNYLRGLEFAKPVVIGHRCWVGGNAIILPGVTIGNDVTVGAGSVVTKDVAHGVVVAGNPARVVRKVEGYEGDES
jgi:maltose O-acetyltransferase